MRLILRKTIEALGGQGDIIDVKDGYGRNYLIPQGIAYPASDRNLQKLEEERSSAEEQAKRDYLEARRRASQLEGIALVFYVRAGDDGKLFGAVTNADVADKLNEGQLDFDVDRRTVTLEEPLKRLGAHRVPIRFHSQVEVEIEVLVEHKEE